MRETHQTQDPVPGIFNKRIRGGKIEKGKWNGVGVEWMSSRLEAPRRCRWLWRAREARSSKKKI